MFSTVDMKETGWTAKQLRTVGVPAEELIKAEFDLDALRDAGCKVGRAGVTHAHACGDVRCMEARATRAHAVWGAWCMCCARY